MSAFHDVRRDARGAYFARCAACGWESDHVADSSSAYREAEEMGDEHIELAHEPKTGCEATS